MNTTARLSYAIGHRLLGHLGLCRHLHGHNFTFEATVSGNPNQIGYVIDFSDLKKDMRALLDRFDHAMVLCEMDPALAYVRGTTDRYIALSVNPSAEHLSSLLFNYLQDRGHTVASVRCQESETGWATTDRVNRTVRITEYRE
jgi:6-pyruvoyltetrahydropterin/6-carboxytetrahydropterin synthase